MFACFKNLKNNFKEFPTSSQNQESQDKKAKAIYPVSLDTFVVYGFMENKSRKNKNNDINKNLCHKN